MILGVSLTFLENLQLYLYRTTNVFINILHIVLYFCYEKSINFQL